ncbi:RES family NAD+ phosphorylase [Rhodobacter sp. NSM]|uniref:RES family NAD+ phosphorylase n=1 Tax=Rhodobacter sp. NSM TaxID=3457501 RepID=UPI003FD478B5
MPPLPPPDIDLRTPLIRTLSAGARLHRFHDRAFGPIWFGQTGTGRLDDPAHAYGVLYVAEGEGGAFSEAFLRRPGLNLIARLHGPGLGVIGATAEVTHGGLPYDAPQAWSKVLHDHPARFDGILYRSRHDDDELCLALFDRAEPDIVEVERWPDLDEDCSGGSPSGMGQVSPPDTSPGGGAKAQVALISPPSGCPCSRR